MRVRSFPKKSMLKVSIIQSIDRKIDLRQIAECNNIDFDQLLDEIEAIVNSGTKINIAYFINEIIDPDDQEEIYDYFRESESDSLEDAYKELCPTFSEEEVRMVKIKFLSEMGN